MGARILMIGGGDVGLQIAAGILRTGAISHLMIADIDAGRSTHAISALDAGFDAIVEFAEVDGMDTKSVIRLLQSVSVDLIVQCACPISPWSIIGRNHPTAKSLGAAGIGIQLPVQIAITMNVMRALRELDLNTPVANLAMPDIVHPVLQTRGLAPTIGLGNASILHLRARAGLKAERKEPTNAADMPQLRVIGHHKHVYEVMESSPNPDPDLRARVYIGDEGERRDTLAYQGKAIAAGPIYNLFTAMAVIPVVEAMLPGASDFAFSAPSPFGLPGGYPIRISGGDITLDLPCGVSRDEAVAFNNAIGAYDGIQSIADDGVVTFSEKARQAVSSIDPVLAEPFDPWSGSKRADRLIGLVREMGPFRPGESVKR